MNSKIFNVNLIFILVINLLNSCKQILPPEKFYFDSKFDSLYKAVTLKDTMFFENYKNGIDTFLLTTIDSILNNEVNCFMCRAPSKAIWRSYKQYPIDYWADTVLVNREKNKNNYIIREANLIMIEKTVYDSSLNKAYFSFKNFQGVLKGAIGKPEAGILKVGNNYFNNYYRLSSSAKSLIRNSTDVEILYFTLKNGIIGYREKSGVFRKRIFGLHGKR